TSTSAKRPGKIYISAIKTQDEKGNLVQNTNRDAAADIVHELAHVTQEWPDKNTQLANKINLILNNELQAYLSEYLYLSEANKPLMEERLKPYLMGSELFSRRKFKQTYGEILNILYNHPTIKYDLDDDGLIKVYKEGVTLVQGW